MVGAMDEKPNDRQGHGKQLQQAAVYYQLGSYDEAQVLLDELARERPESRHVLYSQGLCFAAMGQMQEAWQICEKLHHIKGNTAAALTMKLKARLEEIENEGKPQKRSFNFSLKTLLRLARQPVGMLVCAILFTGSIFLFAALKEEQAPTEKAAFNFRRISEGLAANLDSAQGAHVEVPVFYLAGAQDPVRYAVVVHPCSDDEYGSEELSDKVGAEVAENWPLLRDHVEQVLQMSLEQAQPVEGPEEVEMTRTVVIPREGMALAGGLQGKAVDRFRPGAGNSLRALALAFGPPDLIALWRQGTSLTGIEGDICWWGRIGVATDDNGAVTHLLVRAAVAPKKENPEDTAG